MKKKGLLILLVVFLVAILTFSVFACGGGGKDKGDGDKKPATDTDDKDDGKNDTGLSGRAALKAMLNDIVKTVDDTVKVAGAIKDQASITATIFVDVEVYDEEAKEMVPYHVELNILGSMDKNNADKTWALVQADILGVKANIFAVDSANGETLYIGQNILNEGVKWSKLSQFEDANLLTDFVCKELFGLIGKLQQDSGDKLEAGILSGVEGLTGILDIAGNLTTLIQPADKADYTTATGYGAKLDLSGLSGVMGMLGSLNLTDDIKGIIEMVGGILLGGTLDLDNAAAPFTPGEEKVDIGLSVDKNADGTFAGLGLSYKRGENLKVAFGLKDVAFKAASLATRDNAIAKAAYEDCKNAGELAIAIDLGLDLPKGIYDGKVDVVVKAYPEIKVGFVEGAVKADFTDMYAVAEATFTPAEGAATTYTVAEYNVDPNYPEDIIIDLSCLVDETDVYALEHTQFRVPVDLQAKTGNWTAPAPANAEGDASANIIDVLYTKIAGLFGENPDILGTIMGLVGELENIVDAITPYLDNVTIGESSITVNFETLMAELLAPTGLISTIQSDWNNFKLIKYVDGVPTLVENLKLADLLAPADVLENIVALANTAIYEANKAEGQSYADYFASEDAVRELKVAQINYALGEYGLNLGVDVANIYDNLTLTLGGYAGNGIGFSIGATVGADAQDIGLSLGLRIIEDAAKPATPAIEYAGDVNGIKAQDGVAVSPEVAFSTNTGNDGGAYLLNALAIIGCKYINILSNWVDTYQLTLPPQPGESLGAPIAVNSGVATTTPAYTMNQSFYYYSITADVAGTITFAGENATFYAGMLMDLQPGPSAYSAIVSGPYEVEAGQTIVFAVSNANRMYDAVTFTATFTPAV